MKIMRRMLSVLLILSMSVTFMPIYTGVVAFADASPTSSKFIIPVVSQSEVPADYNGIYTKEQLDAVRNDLSGNYILMNDITLTAEDFNTGGIFGSSADDWTPIGTMADPFTGTFNGNGHIISGIQNKSTNVRDVGLFGYLDGSGTVRNLGMEGSTINALGSAVHTGVICGYVGSQGQIDNCFNSGLVSGSNSPNFSFTGGIAGGNEGNISNCYNSGQWGDTSGIHFWILFKNN